MRPTREEINNAHSWLNLLDEEIVIPKLRWKQRQLLKKPITQYLQTTGNELIKKFGTIADTDWKAFEGAICKITYDMLVETRNILGLKKNRSNKSKNTETNKREMDIINRTREANDTQVLAELIQRIRDINADPDMSQATKDNAIASIEMQALGIGKKLGIDQWRVIMNDNTINSIDVQGIRNLVRSDTQHLDNHIAWVSNELARLIKEEKGKDTASAMQETYDDDPRRAMKWFVTDNKSPDCTIPIPTIEQTFIQRWARDTSYTAPSEDNIFRLPSCIDENTKAIITNALTDPWTFQNVIDSRSCRSSAGPDMITYSIIMAGGKESGKIIAEISKKMLECKQFPAIWAKATSILIYKKGDPNDLSNWRPLSIASSMYRIWSCAVSNTLQQVNKSSHIISKPQKGFVTNVNGCMEHTVVSNELIFDARRKGSDIHIVALDLRDAFGSVPHEYIYEAIREVGLPEALVEIIKKSFSQSSTRFRIGSARSEEIMIRRGVKQGCPLSPLLFDICLEPLIRTIEGQCSQLGYHFGSSHITKTIQAYADDLILFSDDEQNMKTLLNTVELFLNYSKLNINHLKCKTISIGNRNNQRVSLHTQFALSGNQLPIVDLDDGVEYLGMMISNNRSKRMKSTEELVIKAIKDIEKLDATPLRFNQKIDAIKRFIVPSLDYIITNGEVPQKMIDKLEAAIKRVVDHFVGNNGVLKEFPTTHWKDGGVGLQPLKERSNIMRVKLMAELFNFASSDTVALMRQSAEEERIYRGVAKTEPSRSRFIDWETDGNGDVIQQNTHGCDTTVIRAMHAAKKLQVHISYNSNKDVEIFDILSLGSPPEMIPKNIVRMLIKRKREENWNALTTHPFHGHSFTLTRNNPDSNYFIGNPTCRMSDKMVKFVLKGRLNLLPTGELLDKRNPNAPQHVCPKCHDATHKDSLMHRLNGCRATMNQMTVRHNAVQKVIKDEISNKYRVPVKSNCTVRIGNRTLPQRSAVLKPDLWFEYNNEVQLVEFTVPYGDMTTDTQGNRISSLKSKYNEKVSKYSDLLLDIKNTFNKEAKLTVIVVSSLGVIPNKTTKAIQDLLQLSKKNLQRVVRRIVYEAIRGSYLLFYDIINNTREAITTAANDRTLGDSDREEPSD